MILPVSNIFESVNLKSLFLIKKPYLYKAIHPVFDSDFFKKKKKKGFVTFEKCFFFLVKQHGINFNNVLS